MMIVDDYGGTDDDSNDNDDDDHDDASIQIQTPLTPPLLPTSYAEAHKIKLKSDALEAWELEKWHSERQQDLLQKEAKFKFNKQQV